MYGKDENWIFFYGDKHTVLKNVGQFNGWLLPKYWY